MEKTIKNVTLQYRTDYFPTETVEIVVNTEVIKKAMLVTGSITDAWFDSIIVCPNKSDSYCTDKDIEIESISVTEQGFVLRFLLRAECSEYADSVQLDMDDLSTEKDRYLLYFGDDNEVHEFDPEEDDIDDFDVYRASSLEEAEEMCRSAIKEVREADPSYYGLGGDFTQEQD